jgi:hypothetical protein
MFEDVFGPLDDVLKDTPAEQNEWDTGEVWDSGEKENIWRTADPAAPGQVWTTGSGGCGGGCPSCDDDECEDDKCEEVEEGAPKSTLGAPVAHPGNDGNPGPHHDAGGLSESEQLDEFDDELEMSEEDEDLGSPTGVFDDIFG